MAEGFKKYRKHNKIYGLPQTARAYLDDMLMDTSITYDEISGWLKREGYDISKSTVGRYSMETKKLANRLLETREQVRELVKMAQASADDGENLTEGAIQIATHKLTEKIAMMDIEIDEMDAADAIDLTIKMARTKAYKDKVYDSMKKAFEKAYERFKKEVRAELEGDSDLIARLEAAADGTLGKVYEN